MSFGDAIQRRADLLRKRGADVERIFRETSKGATIQAVRAAQDKTPMTQDDLAGVGSRSSHLKESWASASKVKPIVRPCSGGVEYVTVLANDLDYASYVDQGHRMDKHFVPGLVIDTKTGKLERVDPHSGPNGKLVGIVVGTKTSYVPGVFMAAAGHDAFEDSTLRELNKIAREVFRDG